MAKAVISYDKDLPEIPDRQPHLPPDSYLRKKKGTEGGFELSEGRRSSKLLLVNKPRNAVGGVAEGGTPEEFWRI